MVLGKLKQSYCISLLGRPKYMRAGMCDNVLCYLWVQGPESYPRNTGCFFFKTVAKLGGEGQRSFQVDLSCFIVYWWP